MMIGAFLVGLVVVHAAQHGAWGTVLAVLLLTVAADRR